MNGSGGRGPNPTANCTVCRSAMVGFIDAGIASGSTLRSIANSTGVSYAALRRHAANHVAPRSSGAVPTAASAAPLPPGASPLDSMRRRLDVLNAMDESTMSSRDRIQHSEELRRAAETLARMEPPSRPDGVSFAEVDGLAEFFADIAGLAAKFPMIQSDLAAISARHFPMTEAT